MTTPFYQSAEPTKVCTVCGGTFEYKFLVPGHTSPNGVRTLCKPCRAVQQAAERKRKAERIKALVKAEAEVRKLKPDLVPPRTFNYLKSKETWSGFKEPQYVRNNGNKHIPSKGV